MWCPVQGTMFMILHHLCGVTGCHPNLDADTSPFSSCPYSSPVWYHWGSTQLERHRLPAGFQLHRQIDEKEGLKVIKYDDEEFMPRIISCNQTSATVVICNVMLYYDISLCNI